MTVNEKQEMLNEQWRVVQDRKSQLASTDYISAKIAEGAATIDDYADVISKRESWRQDIRLAMKTIRDIETIIVEEPEELI